MSPGGVSDSVQPMVLIAPDAEFDWQTKTVRELSALLRPQIVDGHVTYDDMTHTLREQNGGSAWILGHGTREGIVVFEADPSATPGSMATQTLLQADTLVRLVRGSGIRLLVLATCQSADLGWWINEQTGAIVICTLGEIGMRTAYESLVLLAQMLARGMAVRDAFDAAAPSQLHGEQKWRLFSSESATNGDRMTLHILRAVDMATAPLREQIEQLSRRMDQRMDSLDKRVEAMDARVAPRNSTRYRAYLLGLWLFMTPIVLLMPEVRQALGISALVTLSILFAAWSLGATIVSYGQGWIR